MTQRRRWVNVVLRLLRLSHTADSATVQASSDPSLSAPVDHLTAKALTLNPPKQCDQSEGLLNYQGAGQRETLCVT
jgi:hypothetical protein